MQSVSRRDFGILMAGVALTATATAAGPALAQEVRVNNARSFSGVTEVAIGSFIVAFLTERTDRARAGGGLLGGGFGGNSRAVSTLQGVSDADFQAATEAAYADFLSRLAEAGLTVVPRDPVVAAFNRAGAQPLENGLERDVILARDSRAKAKVFAPAAIGGVWLPREVLGQISAPGSGGNRSAILISSGGTAHARTSRQAVVNAFYIVDFANAETYGGWFRNSSAVSVQAGLALVSEVSKVFAYTPDGRVPEVILREPIAVGGDFGTFSDATSGGHRAAEMAANVIGVLGGIGSNRSRRYVMQADAARWSAGIAELSTASNARMIDALKTGR